MKPDIAVSGVSYGGGQSLELATLKNRMRLTDGRLVPFTSPVHARAHGGGRRLRHVAVGRPGHGPRPQRAPVVGHRHPRRPTTAAGRGGQAELGHAALRGDPGGYLAPPGADPQSDLTTWEHEMLAGEPYSRLRGREPSRSSRTYKSAIGVPLAPGGPGAHRHPERVDRLAVPGVRGPALRPPRARRPATAPRCC